MARITLRQLLDHAAEHGYGVPAFNINNMEQGLAIMEAAAAVDAPVIIQASRGARNYANDIVLAELIDALVELYPDIPLCMHQDHGNSEATCATAIQYGFTSVMMDGIAEGRRQDRRRLRLQRPRHPPRGRDGPLGRRLGRRRDWACWAAWRPAWARRKTATASKASSRTTSCSPTRTRRWTSSAPPRSTPWPSPWAPATAPTSSRASRTATVLAMGVIEEIHRRLPNTHLVMHGSSSVPQDLQDVINRYGGDMPQTWGVPVEEISRGIRHGVRKINIDTDNRMAMTGAHSARLLSREPGANSIRANT